MVERFKVHFYLYMMTSLYYNDDDYKSINNHLGIQLYTEVRPITSRASLLPRTHGSALFTRGETQVVAVTTLGTNYFLVQLSSITKSISL